MKRYAPRIRNSVGSSPRVWGTCWHGRPRDLRSRFIPTCVGNITRQTKRSLGQTVHPHVCGEHAGVAAVQLDRNGSSPRVWGTFPSPPFQKRPRRFIPTCVGNIARRPSPAAASAVHPHVCGEHDFFAGRAVCIFRFIPTCVGNMIGVGKFRSVGGGSSPRVWGTCTDRRNHWARPRFIPTCVGNINDRRLFVIELPVHPHVCGEHWLKLTALDSRNGSSPRVWGTYPCRPCSQLRHRFIPTCVGNMDFPTILTILQSVHPHVCGEHFSTIVCPR